MRLSAPPTPGTHMPSELNGQELFSQIGCALCHSPSLQTDASTFTGISHVTIHPYSALRFIAWGRVWLITYPKVWLVATNSVRLRCGDLGNEYSSRTMGEPLIF
jgi:hypothetical protein